MEKVSVADQEKIESKPPVHFEVALTADISSMSPIVTWVMHLVRDTKYASGKEFEIEMALREALANAIVHGCKSDPEKKIECTVTASDKDGILIVVSDPGDGFDPQTLPCPTNEQNVFSDRGRGIYLIDKLMDEVRFERNGAEIHMRKY
jgi:serine/threonine-protein kinase RsbW